MGRIPGPPPKRTEDRIRRAKPANGDTEKAEGLKTTIPRADKEWHPLAKKWFNSLKTSGQSKYYQNSDWATACLVAFFLSKELNNKRGINGQALNTIFSMMGNLLTTEGERRRLRLELIQAEQERETEKTVSLMQDYMELLKDEPVMTDVKLI